MPLFFDYKQPDTDHFTHIHQKLALEVAMLPLLRKDLDESYKQLNEGFIANNDAQKDAYLRCAKRIQELAEFIERT